MGSTTRSTQYSEASKLRANKGLLVCWYCKEMNGATWERIQYQLPGIRSSRSVLSK
jgi:hypothetical protein